MDLYADSHKIQFNFGNIFIASVNMVHMTVIIIFFLEDIT